MPSKNKKSLGEQQRHSTPKDNGCPEVCLPYRAGIGLDFVDKIEGTLAAVVEDLKERIVLIQFPSLKAAFLGHSYDG